MNNTEMIQLTEDLQEKLYNLLGDNLFKALKVIIQYVDKNGVAKVSQSSLAKALKISKTAVNKKLKRMENINLEDGNPVLNYEVVHTKNGMETTIKFNKGLKFVDNTVNPTVNQIKTVNPTVNQYDEDEDDIWEYADKLMQLDRHITLNEFHTAWKGLVGDKFKNRQYWNY